MRCWYTRWQMSNALERDELASRMTRGHAARCAACQAFGAGLASLHERLSRGGHAAPRPVVVERSRWPLRVGAPLAVGAAAAIALAIGTGGGPVAPTARPPVARSQPLVSVDAVASRLAQVFESSPLETELAALIHDGRRGLDAIVATGGLGWLRRATPADDRNP
jgi:hypothetical protein